MVRGHKPAATDVVAADVGYVIGTVVVIVVLEHFDPSVGYGSPGGEDRSFGNVGHASSLVNEVANGARPFRRWRRRRAGVLRILQCEWARARSRRSSGRPQSRYP